MGTKTNLSEHIFLVSTENDFMQFGKTNKKCPRCGNEIICVDNTSSYIIKCKSENCIEAEFRGI